jgi:hypothetical protein
MPSKFEIPDFFRAHGSRDFPIETGSQSVTIVFGTTLMRERSPLFARSSWQMICRPNSRGQSLGALTTTKSVASLRRGRIVSRHSICLSSPLDLLPYPADRILHRTQFARSSQGKCSLLPPDLLLSTARYADSCRCLISSVVGPQNLGPGGRRSRSGRGQQIGPWEGAKRADE